MALPRKRDLLDVNGDHSNLICLQSAKRRRHNDQMQKEHLDNEAFWIFQTIASVRESILDYLPLSSNTETIFLSDRTTERYFLRRSCNLSKEEYSFVTNLLQKFFCVSLREMLSFFGILKTVSGSGILQAVFRLRLDQDKINLLDGSIISVYQHNIYSRFVLSYSFGEKHDIRPWLTDKQRRFLKNNNRSHYVNKISVQWDCKVEKYVAVCVCDSQDVENLYLSLDENYLKIYSHDIFLKARGQTLHTREMSNVGSLLLIQPEQCCVLMLVIDHAEECALNRIDMSISESHGLQVCIIF